MAQDLLQGTPPSVAAAHAVAAADGDTQVVLLTGRLIEDDYALYRLNPTAALARQFRQSAEDFAADLAERELVSYSAGRVPSEWEAVHIPRSEVPQLEPLIAAARNPVELELFDPKSKDAGRLRMFIVEAAVGRRRASFLRAMAPSARLARRGKIAAVMRGGAYDRLEADPLLFDSDFDAVVVGDDVIVAKQGNFQRALDFVEQTQALAAATLQELNASVPVANFGDLLQAAMSDLRMASKVRSIHEKLTSNPRYRDAMTMPRLVAFIQAHPELEIELTGPPGNEQLVFHPDPQRRWRILKLLDDDYLHSQVTDIDYEANSKQMM